MGQGVTAGRGERVGPYGKCALLNRNMSSMSSAAASRRERRQVEPRLDEAQDRRVVVDRVRDVSARFENGEIATNGTRMP